ncbi:hypothetical protein D3P05_00720 [Paracoccus siganidrum]|uniref:Uncharacterized protein n=1 Tax=Paracoccus siganidrum TaxID=1276757 RepID=A0A419ACE5_9RHOB|nr:hypothetical protein D3P05_00720 [Paracoccus siganidrum]
MAASVGSLRFRCCSFLLCFASSEAIDQKLVDEHGIMKITHTQRISASSDLLVSNMGMLPVRHLEVLRTFRSASLMSQRFAKRHSTPFRK